MEWDVFFKNQLISSDYSKTPFLVQSVALFLQKLCLGLVLDKGYYSDGISTNYPRSVNTENTVRQA